MLITIELLDLQRIDTLDEPLASVLELADLADDVLVVVIPKPNFHEAKPVEKSGEMFHLECPCKALGRPLMRYSRYPATQVAARRNRAVRPP